MISVALCTYNGAEYIEKQILSILNQSVPVDEIVICDDGSTDNTIEIIEKIKNNTAIRLIHNYPQLGVVKNFERAISTCQGDVIFLCDQDDIWYPNKVEITLKYFENNPTKKVLFTNADLVDSNDEKMNISLFECVGLDEVGLKRWDNEDNQIMILFIENRCTGATMAIRKEVKDWILPFDDSNPDYIHDGQIVAKAVDRKCLGYIKEPLMGYRQHSSQQLGILDWYKNSPSTDILHCHENSVRPQFINYVGDKYNKSKIQFFLDRFDLIKKSTTKLKKFSSLTKVVARIPKYIYFCKSEFMDYFFLDVKRILKK